jgi:hypothetical protein
VVGFSFEMKRVWQTVRGYVLWTYERGSLHYDVMVTLILAFVFLAPLWIDFRDKPAQPVAHQTQVAITPDGATGFICRVDASAIRGASDEVVHQELLGVLEPILGEIQIRRYERLRDPNGRLVAYRAWVRKS